jgi:AcrR family transcriptional regulator
MLLISILRYVNTCVYGLFMTAHLTKSHWLNYGIKTLVSTGFTGLKAEPLSKALRVTRGSFYWHFSDIKEFHKEILMVWKTRTTDDVIEEIEKDISANDRLYFLLTKAMLDDQKLERAIRLWADQNHEAANVVAFVDDLRLNYLIKILKSSEINDSDLKLRANIIYWAYLGRMMTDSSNKNWNRIEIQKLAKLLQS